MKKQYIFSAVAAVVMTGMSSFCIADQINLYAQPNAKSKMVGSINLQKGVIPIYEKKDWMEIGDPNNGNVGWVKIADFKAESQKSGIFITQRFIDTSKGPKAYEIFNYGSPQQLSANQTQTIMKQMELRHQMIEKNMRQTMQDLAKNFNQGFVSFPVIMPVVVVPESAAHNSKKQSLQDVNGKPIS